MSFFFLNDTATPEISTLSLRDALPILQSRQRNIHRLLDVPLAPLALGAHVDDQRRLRRRHQLVPRRGRSEEHTSELQSPFKFVCRILLVKINVVEVVIWRENSVS